MSILDCNFSFCEEPRPQTPFLRPKSRETALAHLFRFQHWTRLLGVTIHTFDLAHLAVLGYPEQAGIETYLIERKLDNCKPCGGAIPLCMIDEFDLPKDIVDREASSRMKFGASPLLIGVLSNFPLLASPKNTSCAIGTKWMFLSNASLGAILAIAHLQSFHPSFSQRGEKWKNLPGEPRPPGREFQILV